MKQGKNELIKNELIAQFLTILDEQGFDTDYIKPYLACIIYDELGNENDRLTPEGCLRFEVRYPDMSPICQYCQWEDRIITRDEWFVSQGSVDVVFERSEGESAVSFYKVFKFASVAPMLRRLGMDPKKVAPWAKREANEP